MGAIETAPEFPILRDKLEAWDMASKAGAADWRGYNERAAAELRRLFKLVDDMRAALVDCEEYFDNRADADCEGDPLEFVPNREMRLLDTVQAVLPRLPAAPSNPTSPESAP